MGFRVWCLGFWVGILGFGIRVGSSQKHGPCLGLHQSKPLNTECTPQGTITSRV